MKITTFNIRCAWRVDGINGFIHRAGLIYEKILKEMPDIIAFQELIPEMQEFLERLFPEYIITGHGRTNTYNSEGVFTAVKKSSMQLIENNTVWLSPTPFVPESRFPNQSVCPRTLNITKVRCKEDGKLMRIFNVHLDEKTEEARRDQLKLILDFVDKYNEELYLPYVILGDFNSKPGGEAVALMEENQKITDLTKGFDVTFHNFGRGDGSKIDYIYVSDELKERFLGVSAWEDVDAGIYLSDHYPLCAEFK